MAKKAAALSPEDIALERVLAYARQKMLPFTQWTYQGEFKVNWHHRIIGEALDKFISREIPNLMLFMPPGTGKSQMMSRHMPAKILGMNPKARIIATSYSAELAEAMNRDVQFIIDSDEFAALYPGTVIPGSRDEAVDDKGQQYLRNNTTFETVPHRGIYRCAGVGGAILGMRGDYLLIDDPYKNRQEAESENTRNAVFEWYRSTLYSRRAKGAGICLSMQRWHDDDLAGKILKLAAEDPNYPQFVVLRFPMLSTDERLPGDPRTGPGQPLWPAMFDLKECIGMQKSAGSRNWQAMYQQVPNEEGGTEVKAGQLQYWKELPQFPDRVILSCDAAFKKTDTSSYVAIQIWFQAGTKFYLADQHRERLGFLDTVRAIETMKDKWPSVSGFLIEDKANGPAIVEMLKKKFAGVLDITPYGSKLARFRAVTPLIEAGDVLIPSPETHEWVPAYEKELQTVPNCKDWDQVDTTSQALHYFQENSSTLAMLNTN